MKNRTASLRFAALATALLLTVAGCASTRPRRPAENAPHAGIARAQASLHLGSHVASSGSAHQPGCGPHSPWRLDPACGFGNTL